MELTLKELEVPIEVATTFPGPQGRVEAIQARNCGRMRYGGGDDFACVISIVAIYRGQTVQIRSFVASESAKLFRARDVELRRILRTLEFLAPA